jgi:hypothetical protein
MTFAKAGSLQSALNGKSQADSFVSSNRELIRQIADFECLTPENFIQKYLC